MIDNSFLQKKSRSGLKHQFLIGLILIWSNSFIVEAQPCSPFQGYTTWLGYSDAWDDSTNWCPPIAPVNTNPAMNVRLSGGPSGFYPYFRPVIKNGVIAVANNLRIESGDTLFVNNAIQSSLTINDSLYIENVTAGIIVNNNSATFPIFIRGHWENNGIFEAGQSIVKFDGAINYQEIGGQVSSAFYDLHIDNTSHVVLLSDCSVEDSLLLINGRLKLNLKMISILNSDFAAISRVNGAIQSETDLLTSNVFPFGRINWKMGSSPGVRVIPFINSFGVYIPMSYNIVSGFHDLILSTYGTYPDNINLPLPEVTNVYCYINGSIDSSGNSVVDRFYLLHDLMGVNPVANVTFTYAAQENAGFGNSIMRAQRWINSTSIWENPLLPLQIFTPGATSSVSLTIPDTVFATSDWWTISNLSFPLGTGINENINENILAYPNPLFAGDFLKFNNSMRADFAELFSVDGRLILKKELPNDTGLIKIPADCSPGIYTMIFRNSVETVNFKVVILGR